MESLCRIRDIYRAINDFETALQQKYDIGLNEAMLLCSLSSSGECSSGRIAELLGLSCSNASKVIVSSEKKGLVKRSLGERDRRRMFFSLTGEGEARFKAVKSGQDDMSELTERIKGFL